MNPPTTLPSVGFSHFVEQLHVVKSLHYMAVPLAVLAMAAPFATAASVAPCHIPVVASLESVIWYNKSTSLSEHLDCTVVTG